jgi:hypothetical protein
MVMSGFDEREAAFEKRFALEGDKEFRVRVRRDRLVALWAAEWLGVKDDERETYVSAFVEHNVARDDLAIAGDLNERFAAANKPMEKERIERKLAAALAEAQAMDAQGR